MGFAALRKLSNKECSDFFFASFESIQLQKIELRNIYPAFLNTRDEPIKYYD